uniref:Uncharacterized protein n=1 Tax=Tanacetum cinerariifolium TaxID=118510 RepID=A0A699VY10_TANCI|nr:hypothetical protein [Tanacetum cinerariifolium]
MSVLPLLDELSTWNMISGLRSRDYKAEDKGEEAGEGQQAEIYQIDMDHVAKVLSMQEDEPEVKELVEVVTTAKLITDVVTV